MENTAAPSRTVGGFIVAFIGLFVLWVVFTGSLDSQELIAGVVVSALSALLVGAVAPGGTLKAFSPIRWAYGLAFLGYLSVAIFKSNIDMALIVTRPKINIRPGIVRVKTALTSPIGRLVLANAITLTPGTLSVDIEGDELFIHWVNVEADDIDEATRKIVTGFERFLGGVFG